MGTNQQSGFAIVETLLVVVILGILGFTGWFVWHAKQATDISLTNTTKNSVGISKPKTKTVTKTVVQAAPVDSQKYLTIKEWGVKIPLSSVIESAVYVSDQYSTETSSATGGSAKLGLLSLGSDCGTASNAPLGEYVEFTQSDVDQEDVSKVEGAPSLHTLAKSAVSLGKGYMYAYANPQYSCSSDTSADLAATAAFKAALSGIKSADQ